MDFKMSCCPSARYCCFHQGSWQSWQTRSPTSRCLNSNSLRRTSFEAPLACCLCVRWRSSCRGMHFLHTQDVRFLTSVYSAWSFAASSMVIGIYGGGPAVEIWGSLAVGAALSIFCLNLAEYASAFPSSAGVTYAAARLGGPKYGRMAVRRA
jgi:hypothetical protein